MKAGVEGDQEVVKAVPGVGTAFVRAVRKQFETIAESCWRAEFSKMFTVFGLHSSGRAWHQEPPPNESWAAKAQEWMRVPSWVFCPECGRRELKTQVAWQWRRNPESCVQRPCPHGCDLPPQELQQELEEPLESKSLKAYVTPQLEHWQAWVQHIAPEAAPETLLHQVVPAEDLLALGIPGPRQPAPGLRDPPGMQSQRDQPPKTDSDPCELEAQPPHGGAALRSRTPRL